MKYGLVSKLGLGIATALVALNLWLPVTAAKEEAQMERLERFRLATNCAPMSIAVEHLPTQASKIGLSRTSIQTAAESRLRSARLFDSSRSIYLYIQVNVTRYAFNAKVNFNKHLYDPISKQMFTTITWSEAITGTHSQDSGYILSHLYKLLDEFLVDYLRVNEKACEKR